MKLVLVFAVIVGVGLAKPSVDKDLIALVKKVLAKKIGDNKSDNNSIDDKSGGSSKSIEVSPENSPSTILAGVELLEGFQGIPDGLLDFSEPVDVKKARTAVAKKLNAVISEIVKIAGDIEELFADVSASESAQDVLARFAPIEQLVQNEEADTEKVQGLIKLNIIEAAIAGTSGDTQNEIGCDFEGEANELLTCVINKLYMMDVATERMLADAITFYTSSEGPLAACADVHEALNAEKGGGELGLAFKSFISCIKGNMQVFKGHATDDTMFPTPLPDLFIPRALGATILIDGMNGMIWWCGYSLYEVVRVLSEEAGVPFPPPGEEGKKRALSRFVQIHNSKSKRTYEAFAKKAVLKQKAKKA